MCEARISSILKTSDIYQFGKNKVQTFFLAHFESAFLFTTTECNAPTSKYKLTAANPCWSCRTNEVLHKDGNPQYSGGCKVFQQSTHIPAAVGFGVALQ